MDQVVVISGAFTGQAFVPDGPLPAVEGRAELVVHVPAEKKPSMIDFLGKAPRLCSAEELDARLDEERRAWDDP